MEFICSFGFFTVLFKLHPLPHTHTNIMKNSNWKRSLYIIYTSIYIFIAITKAEEVANITEKFV